MKKAEVEMSATQSSVVHIQETDVREIEKVGEEEEANLIPETTNKWRIGLTLATLRNPP